jgi:hypothetical protein
MEKNTMPPKSGISAHKRAMFGLFFAAFAIFFITCIPFHEAAGQTPDAPYVISTSPANGQADVSRDLNVVSITFSEPMQHYVSVFGTWYPFTVTCSSDSTVFYFTRTSTDKLPPYSGFYMYLNRDGAQGNYFRDLDGYPLPTYYFSFSTGGSQIQKIPADPAKGFYWPYYLSIPDEDLIIPNTVLQVAPNNSGTVNDDPAFHDDSANNLTKMLSPFALAIGAPLLVPTFPRPENDWPDLPPDLYQQAWKLYTQALDRDSLRDDLPVDLKRIDLQLIAMIEDARERLLPMGMHADAKVFMWGFSANGMFVNRFTLLHPERVKAVASGSSGGWPTVPVSTWQASDLIYPVGISDLSLLTGQDFDLDGFKLVPQYIYVGDKDDNDAVDYPDGFSDEERQLIYTLFGDPQYIWERYPKAQQIYDSVGARATFKIYPGVGHTITQEMYLDANTFFEQSWYPLIQITNPTENPTYCTDQATIDITGTAVDDVNVTQVTWSNNRGGSGVASGTTSWSVSGVILYPGKNIITVTAWDASGNTGADTIKVTQACVPSYLDYVDTVQKIYIGYYQRPADPCGLIYWANRLFNSGGNLSEIIEAFANSAESQALYGTINSSNISTVVNGIYNALFGRNAEAGGLNYYVNGFNSGQFTAATIMLNVLNGAQNKDLQSINNKLTAANLFTRTIDPELDCRDFQVTYSGDKDAQKARNFLSTVGGDPATIPTQAEVTLFIKNNIADPGDPILNP